MSLSFVIHQTQNLIQCNSVKISGKIFHFFVVVLISFFLVVTDVYALEKEAQQEAERNNEKIISVLQKGIGLLKYEIQRDQSFASRKMLIPTLRQLRITLKNDIESKEQLINDLRSFLSKELVSEIGSLLKTLEQEKTIIENIQTSKRVRRVTRNTIKGLISVKENILASFERVLSEVIIEQGSEKTLK